MSDILDPLNKEEWSAVVAELHATLKRAKSGVLSDVTVSNARNDLLALDVTLNAQAAELTTLRTERDRVRAALDRAEQSAMIDGAHHKQWVIDQMIRALLGEGYATWRVAYDEYSRKNDYSEWDEGIAP
jgi:hypothetical protein